MRKLITIGLTLATALTITSCGTANTPSPNIPPNAELLNETTLTDAQGNTSKIIEFKYTLKDGREIVCINTQQGFRSEGLSCLHDDYPS